MYGKPQVFWGITGENGEVRNVVNRTSVVYYVTVVVYDDLQYGTLRSSLSKKMIYYNGSFLVCRESGGIYKQIGAFTLLIYHALSLKLSSKNIPWVLIYPILCHTSFIF